MSRNLSKTAASQKPTSAWMMAHKIGKLETHYTSSRGCILSRLDGSVDLSLLQAFLRVTLGSFYCLDTHGKEDLVKLVNFRDSLELFCSLQVLKASLQDGVFHPSANVLSQEASF